LVTAKRGHNDWRYYGTTELERLNTITVLKTLGMTLAQIRDLVRTQEPSLERVLAIQVQAWQTKKLDAERGLVLAELALKRVQTQQSLSIDAICNLIRALEFNDHSVSLRSLLNEELTPAEYAAAMQFLKQNCDLSRVKAQIQEETDIFKKLRLMMEGGVPADADEVLQLLIEHKQVGLQAGNHQRALKMIEWNRDLGTRFFNISMRIAKKMQSQSDVEPDPSVLVTPKLLRYFFSADKHAPWTKPMLQLVADSNELLTRNPDPTSDEAKDLVQRYRETYTTYALGDPDVDAKLIPHSEVIHYGWSAWAGADAQAAWLFLSAAVIYACNKESAG
jgi:DNA-binding transcriptional MerR regulator